MSEQLLLVDLLTSPTVNRLVDITSYGFDAPDCHLCGEKADYQTGAAELDGYRVCEGCYAEWLRVSHQLRAVYKDFAPDSIGDYWLGGK